MNKGYFTISLDFELYWGMRDKVTIDKYKQNLSGVWQAVPAMLDLFAEYGIHATWSTVGILFFQSKDDLLKGLPKSKPLYTNEKLSPYPEFENHEIDDEFHFSPMLIKKILSYPNQRIGTHTFSHYYCLEDGQTVEAFKEDLLAAMAIAEQQKIKIESLVFPRNQYAADYVRIAKSVGIKCFRGNENSWLYTARNGETESLFRRALRLADSFINISGHNCSSIQQIQSSYPFNIPSSRFLRPVSHKLKPLDPLRLRRITSGLTYAAKKGKVFHLWWHPHNFGVNLKENMFFLEKILNHYQVLNKHYGIESLNMEEVSELLRSES